MKKGFYLFAAAAALVLFLAFGQVGSPDTGHIINKPRKIVRCGPDWESLNVLMNETDIPPMPGTGNHKWRISTRSDSAQFYFNQGINMYYAFHIIESMASFKKAARFDPSCAMLYWAQALAYGPNINDLGYTSSPDALIAINKAVELAEKASLREKVLIYAQSSRYSADTTETREELNQRYADNMKIAYANYNYDADVAALYADALMLQHPWDLWKNDGTPKPWTPLIRTILEKLLDKSPQHPGANHYYIHVMEPSPFAAKALPSAYRLGKLTPGLSHTVHMPSHIFLRTGNYELGSSVNETAVKSYRRAIGYYAPVTGNDFLYIIHNLHMQTNHAMMAGRSAYAQTSAKETVKSIPEEYLSFPAPMGSAVQYIHMTPLLVDVRFGNWNALLNRPEPASNLVYARILWHFGKGMAQSNLGGQEEARLHLSRLQKLMKDSNEILSLPLAPFSAAIEGAKVAEKILEGTIFMKDKNYDAAISVFEKAVAVEENMVYNEPRDWILNPKHYLGNAYLKSARQDDAIRIFESDLRNNQENGWALFGIYQALMFQRKSAEAAEVLTRFQAAFNKSDIKLTAPVF
jgi:tetratricopeptide (TPR) repeat protein